MLYERSMNLLARIGEYTQLRVANDAAEAYQTRLKQVREETARLRPLMLTREILGQQGILVVPVADMASRIQPRLRDLCDRYNADPAIITSQQALGRLPQELTSLANRLQDQLTNAWTAYTEERMVEVSDTFLTLFDRIPEAQETVRRIRLLRNQLITRRGRLPISDKDVIDFHAAVEQQKALVHELEGFPPSVLAFLRAAASGGAELELLTDEVRQWLTERGMKNAFRILAR